MSPHSLLALLPILLSAAAVAQPVAVDVADYRIVTLPPQTYMSRITDNGDILLQAPGSAFVLRRDAMSPVVLPVADAAFVHANGMNESGDIVGEYRDAGNVAHPFAILRGEYRPLPDVAGRTPLPSDINQQRTITGSARKPGEYDVGFVLVDGSFTLFQCDPNGHTNPVGINRNGDVAGTCGTYVNLRGFVYRGGAFAFVAYPGAVRTRVFDINGDGDLVGDAFFEDAQGRTESKAFLWRNGTFHDLAFPGTRQSVALSINDRSDVLGRATIVHFSNGGALLGIGYVDFVRNVKSLR